MFIEKALFSFSLFFVHQIYMRSWITGLPNVTIFSVDYSLRQKYPNALQDVLDSYFWLSSGSMQVREVLGFNPSKVVVAGDSAGANLVYTLCLLLTNMHDYAKENNVPWVPPIPHSIVSVYGFYDFTTPSPIMVNSFIDLLLPPTIIRIAFGSMVEGCDEPYQRMSKFFNSTIFVITHILIDLNSNSEQTKEADGMK